MILVGLTAIKEERASFLTISSDLFSSTSPKANAYRFNGLLFYLEFLFLILYNKSMKQIYGFKIEVPDEWSDVFDDEFKSPEYLISSACHIYYDISGESYIGFDVSLGLELDEMNDSLAPYCKKPGFYKVL